MTPPHDRDWDEWYEREGAGGPVWSGEPNATLVAEVAGLAPGSALDVGCGEGADAIWLAERGWRVTAIDPAASALERAAAAASAAGVEVDWVRAGLLELPTARPGSGGRGGPAQHDLVAAHYAVLPNTPEALAVLLAAVAPGGTLLVVHHEGMHEIARKHGYDPADFLGPDDIAGQLDEGWTIEVHEPRDRPEHLRARAPHVRDVVLRARRTGAAG